MSVDADPRIRPLELDQVFERVQGTVVPRLRAAVERLHNFSLMHDAVMDGAPTRRSRQSVWWQFGMPTAILAGDALLPLAIEVLAEVPGSVHTLCEAVRGLVHGQSLDIEFEQRDDV